MNLTRTTNADQAETRPCGLYRTSRPLGETIPAGRLVFLHDHGKRGATLHVPQEWRNNKSIVPATGIRVEEHGYLDSLERLAPEGFYRVRLGFDCCEKKCTHFPSGGLVQLGYDGAGQLLLFKPRWDDDGLSLPEIGTPVSEDKLRLLQRLALEHERPSPTADQALAMSFPRLGFGHGHQRLH